MAFNAKNLTYDKNEPAFLRRLRGQYADDLADGAKHSVPIARPKKDRLKTGDGDEDAPTIVDEDGETVRKEDFERMQRGEDLDGVKEDDPESVVKADAEGTMVERQKIADGLGLGIKKKRKVGRVVGEAEEQEEREADRPALGDNNDKHASVGGEDSQRLPGSKAGKVKKKAKKVKLSFDDPEEE